MSPHIDPPYPSFTFALSKSQVTPSPPPESIVIRHSDPGTPPDLPRRVFRRTARPTWGAFTRTPGLRPRVAGKID
ncbi:hypothetical protein NUW54_g11695 [Trametes sanguinea]|uniref:Uncharacterized protein n=1 Tax=Trametes sanguinea TaxID=158606 RepID=A0ACC1N9K4_9APHY|nr:hypothetical protein NUW54_g11695 [Trametes sanguinea]